MQAVAPRKRKEKKKARSAARRGRRRENGIDKDLAILATVRRPPLGQAWSMNGTRHRRRSSVPIGRGWYHSGTTSTNRSLVSLLSLGRLRIKIQPGHLLFRLLFLLLPLSPLFFPRLFFLRFYLSTRCSSLLRCFVASYSSPRVPSSALWWSPMKRLGVEAWREYVSPWIELVKSVSSVRMLIRYIWNWLARSL